MKSNVRHQSCRRDKSFDEIEQHIEKGRDEYDVQTMDRRTILICTLSGK